MSLYESAQFVEQDEAESSLSSDTDSQAESSRTPHRIAKLREALWEAIRSALFLLHDDVTKQAQERIISEIGAKGKSKERFERPGAPWTGLANALSNLKSMDFQSSDQRGQAVTCILQTLLNQLFISDRHDKQYRAILPRLEAKAMTHSQSLFRSLQFLSQNHSSALSVQEAELIISAPHQVLLRISHCACSSSSSALDLREFGLAEGVTEELPLDELLPLFGIDRDDITRLQLDRDDLSALPRWVLNLRNLRSISLNANPQLAHLPLGLLKLPIKRIHAHQTSIRSTAGAKLPLIFYSSMAVFAANQRDRHYTSSYLPVTLKGTGAMSLTVVILFRLFELDCLNAVLDALPPHLIEMATSIARCELCGVVGCTTLKLTDQVGGRKPFLELVRARWGLQEFTTGNRKYSAREQKAVKEVVVEGRLCRTCRRYYIASPREPEPTLDYRMSSMALRYHPCQRDSASH